MTQIFDPLLVRAEGSPRLGPRGGNLDNPDVRPQNKGPLNMKDGELHKKDGWQETAVRGIKDEKPWHRMAAYMLVAGRTSSEIAMAAEVTCRAVEILRAQQWFQQLLATIANTEGEAFLGVIKSHALASIERIAHIAEFGETERNRLTANTYLTDQAVGKAVQKTLNVSTTLSSASPQEEMENTLAALADLRRAREASKQQQASPEPTSDLILVSQP